jgi:hypothetical protein
VWHPLHEGLGGMAATHMAQLLALPADQSLFAPLVAALDATAAAAGSAVAAAGAAEGPLPPLPPLPVASLLSEAAPDYWAVVAFLSAFELMALSRNWVRWRRDEYRHPFVGNIGIGNLKDG